MPYFLDPKEFGLTTRTVIEKVDDHTIAIVIDRKSRVIMADGKKILNKACTIKEVKPDLKIILKTYAPVCSKTIKFLNEHDINVI